MAIDFTKPATGDNYSTQFTQNIQANQTALAQWLDSSNTTITGTPPTYAKRYNRTSSAVEEYNGSSWAPLKFHGLTWATGNLIGIGVTTALKRLHLGDGSGSSEMIRFANTLANFDIGATASGLEFTTGNNQAFIWTNNALERMRIDTSGRVNIGATVAGIRQLNINAVISEMTLKSTVASGGAGSSTLYFGNSATDGIGWWQYDHAANHLAAGVNGAERMRIDSSGNVGLGKVPAGVRLDVLGVGRFLSGASGTFNYLDVGRVSVETRIATAASAGDFLAGTAAGDGIFYAASGAAWYGTAAAAAAIFVTGNAERMRIDSSGNVGIGGSPGSKFETFVADTATGAKFKAVTNLVRVRPYVNATDGSLIEATDLAESSYALLTLNGSQLRLNTGGTERARIDAGGQLGLGLAPVTSGASRALLQLLGSANGGIYLGNTANSAANAMDWYEEGTFTPTAVGSTTAGSTTYGVQTGRYLRFGRLLFVYIYVSWSTHTGTGNLRISGLPYAGAYGAMRAVGVSGLAFDAWSAAVNSGQTYLTLAGVNQNTGTNANRAIANGDTWEICGFIEV